MVPRREFLGLVGMSGLGSLLLSSRALAELGSDGKEVLAQTPAPSPSPSPQFSQIKLVMDVGVNQDNIAAVRQAILDTVPAADRDAMIADLIAARDAYAAGYIGDPPAAQALQQKIVFWLPSLANQLPAGPETSATAAGSAAVAAEVDRDPVDGWTLVHFLSGCFLGAVCLGFQTTLRLLILWEIIEPHIWPGWNESPANQIVDVIAGMLGWWVAKEAKEALLEEMEPKQALLGAAA
jgi:hypothetical protein